MKTSRFIAICVVQLIQAATAVFGWSANAHVAAGQATPFLERQPSVEEAASGSPQLGSFDNISDPAAALARSKQEFAEAKFGIFIHWGIYSMFGQGEWYLNYGPKAEEYAKAARGFYPAYFNAQEWVSAFKEAGAKYVCFTTRHHDGFSMWATKQSPYNIVDATPFKRDILKELADECHRQGLRIHLYYSHLDWTRPDYPTGRTGLDTGRDPALQDWDSYYAFMNSQLEELLTNYGEIGAIWFDGKWDHDQDSVPFDWELEKQYALIHNLQPACLVANNHHENVIPGEDFQIFERDVPGQNTAGYSEQDISALPLETCQTMNGMWGYKIKDQDYKSVDDLVRYLVRTAGQGANLLLNIGPQPSGELPAAALERLKGMGQWLDEYGHTIYGTAGSPLGETPDWGTATQKGDTIYLHVLDPEATKIAFSLKNAVNDLEAYDIANAKKLEIASLPGGYYEIVLPSNMVVPDHIIQLTVN